MVTDWLSSSESREVESYSGQEVVQHLKIFLEQHLRPEGNNQKRRFLSREDLESFWKTSLNDIEDVVGRATSKQVEHPSWGRLFSDFGRITCILIWIELPKPKFSAIFERLLFTDQQKVIDARLPLEFSDVEEWLKAESAEFCASQHDFLEPIYIQPSQSIRYEEDRRLPYVGQVSSIGTGGFGEVFQVKVLKRYYRHDAESSNDEDKLVAVKLFRNQRDLFIESRNNDFLRQNLRQHGNIFIHHAAVLHHQTFYIFMELTQIGDLERFIKGGYDLTQEFPNSSISCVLKSFLDLTDALRFLHHDIRSAETGDPLTVVHNDLRPQNILIFHHSSNERDMGRWKIADFGISTLKEPGQSHSDHSQQNVIGDLVPQAQPQPRDRSMEGPHRAPEISSTSYRRGQKADVWSLGCIFTEIIAFAQGFRTVNSLWSKSNSQVEALRDCYGHSFYQSEDDDNGTTTFSLSPVVYEWLKGISAIGIGQHQDVHQNEWVGLALKMLRPDPAQRPDTKEVWKSLQIIHQCMRDGLDYDKPFSIQQETKTLEPWTPKPILEQAVPPIDLEPVQIDAKCAESVGEHWTLEVTRFALLMTRNLSDKNEICVRPIEGLNQQNLSPNTYRLPDGVHWKELELSGVYGCATGKKNGRSEYVHFNIEARKYLQADESLTKHAHLMQAIPSCRGVAAFRYEDQIILRAFNDSVNEILSPPHDGDFSYVTINRTGDKMFARVSCSDPPRQDFICVWSLNDGKRPTLLVSFNVQRPTISVGKSDFYTILPWSHNIGATVIYRHGNVGRGITYTAFTHSKENIPVPTKFVLSIENGLASPANSTAAIMTQEYFVFVDRKQKVWLYKSVSDQETGESLLILIDSEKLPRKKAAWFVFHQKEPIGSDSSTGLQLIVHDDKDYVYDIMAEPKGGGILRTAVHDAKPKQIPVFYRMDTTKFTVSEDQSRYFTERSFTRCLTYYFDEGYEFKVKWSGPRLTYKAPKEVSKEHINEWIKAET